MSLYEVFEDLKDPNRRLVMEDILVTDKVGNDLKGLGEPLQLHKKFR